MHTPAPVRVGVDTGGTFTDCVVFDGGAVRVLKIFSTPADPSVAITHGVRALLEQLGTRTRPFEIIHGTTVGTNTLLERKGARVALVTTSGFEDLLEIGRQNRPRLYDFDVCREPPLVPPARRFGVRERTAANGHVLAAPSTSELRRLVARVGRARPQSVAVCFLFSYANPANERAAEQALRKLGVPISVSREILPEFREFERLSTLVINAYLAPRLGSYLTRLAAAFATRNTAAVTGFAHRGVVPKNSKAVPPRIYVMQSGGGITTAERAAREPVRTLLSGPAGGVVAAARLAERLGVRRAISFDMGGTSTDVSLIDGEPRTTRETTLGGVPVAVPVLDVHSVGAGGGSLARIDAGGALRVGPESAGAAPGPICYGRGGRFPTVTDAHLLLGRLDPANFLGGQFRLDASAAFDAFASFLKEQARRIPPRLLPRTPLDLARGIVAVANATMERALRVVSVERGRDPRDFALVCYGGAGGLHAAELARALGLAQVIVPPNPGAFSALGVLLSDVIRDVSQSVLLPVPGSASSNFIREIERRFLQLERAAVHELRAEGFATKPEIERRLDLRYAGQSYELTVPFSPGYREAFHRGHERAYGQAQPEKPMEIVSLRARLVIKTPKPTAQRAPRRKAPRKPARAALLRSQDVWFEAGARATRVYDRERLLPGDEFRGPAIVMEYSSTTVAPPGFLCRIDGERNLILVRSQ
jgi:N-methylhydantoinase A